MGNENKQKSAVLYMETSKPFFSGIAWAVKHECIVQANSLQNTQQNKHSAHSWLTSNITTLRFA